jgi:hypothetical protein
MGPCNPFKGFIELVAEGSGCIEAETEESVLVLEIKLGIVLETEETVLQRKKNDDGLGRRTIKGNVFKNRAIFFFFFFFTEKERERDNDNDNSFFFVRI